LLHPVAVPDDRWSVVTMDFVTDLPITPRGFDSVAVFVDKLTKMAHLAPTRKTVDALGVAQLLIERVISLHGVPLVMISDRDPRFTSEVFRAVTAQWPMAQHMSSAFHPQSDGQTERMNRLWEDIMRHYVSADQTDWDLRLPMVEFAINNSFHDSTQSTPFRLNYGRDPLTPFTHQLKSRSEGEEVRRFSHLPAAAKFTEHMQESLQLAKQSMQAAQQRQKHYADAHRRDLSLSVGDMVLLHTKNLKLKSVGSRKLLPRWVGPFRVTEVINPVAYRIQLPDNVRIHDVFHVSVLKPYLAQGSVQPPPPVEIEGELEYEVDMILNHRDVSRGKKRLREYLIKWKGYDAIHNSWEPDSNMSNCKETVQEYWTILKRNREVSNEDKQPASKRRKVVQSKKRASQ
jgi:Chromo (CHRromatin Organisation MOdifier) domain